MRKIKPTIHLASNPNYILGSQYIIIDEETGDILLDNAGQGYCTTTEALDAWNQREKDAVVWKEKYAKTPHIKRSSATSQKHPTIPSAKIEEWGRQHKACMMDLQDLMSFAQINHYAVKVKDVNEIILRYSATTLPFTSKDLLRYLYNTTP